VETLVTEEMLTEGQKYKGVRWFASQANENKSSESTSESQTTPITPSSTKSSSSSSSSSSTSSPSTSTSPPKSSFAHSIVGRATKHEARHYWNGTKLLYSADECVGGHCEGELLRGQHISRRERRHLKRTVADMFRLVPFSFFVDRAVSRVHAAVLHQVFPEHAAVDLCDVVADRQRSVRAQIKAKVSIAKFLQETVYDASKRYSGEDMTKFNEFVHKLRSGDAVDASTTRCASRASSRTTSRSTIWRTSSSRACARCSA
jgi:LETM1 and EF-hand domain-containing protein 1